MSASLGRVERQNTPATTSHGGPVTPVPAENEVKGVGRAEPFIGRVSSGSGAFGRSGEE